MKALHWLKLAAGLVAVSVALSAALSVHAAPPPPHQAEAAEPAEHEEEGPKAINWADIGNKAQPPFLAAIINFAVLVGAYVYFGRKPIAAALVARKAAVSKQIEEAQLIKREAEARSEQYTKKLGALTDELAMTRAELAAAGVSERARIVREAEEKAARMQKDALVLLEQERRQVEADLRREAVASAMTAAEALLKTKLTQEDQERVAEEFLTMLASPPKSAARAGGVS